MQIERIKQLLVNNNFPNALVDKITNEFITKKFNHPNRNNRKPNENQANEVIDRPGEDNEDTQRESTTTNEDNNHAENPMGSEAVIERTGEDNEDTQRESTTTNEDTTNQPIKKINIFYMNQMTNRYKQVENELKI